MKDWLLPKEIVCHIYTYDDTFKKIFSEKVIPCLLKKIRDKHYHKLVQAERDFQAITNLLTKTDFPYWLFIYNRKFHTIDKMYFNHYFTKLMFNCHNVCVYLYDL